MFHRRLLQTVLSGKVSQHKTRLLFGARQTGKTELLRHLPEIERGRIYDLQDSAVRRRFEADPTAFSREVLALPRSVRTIAVDEIQKVPALLDEVQGLYDSAPRRWEFYLTGSSARRLRARASNLLPGRSHAYHLFPVCGLETEREETEFEIGGMAKPPAVAGKHRPVSPFPAQSLTRNLIFGNLPGIRSESAARAEATLRTYVEYYLEEEIRREALVRDLGPFAVFIRLAAAESGRQLNLTKLSQESGIAVSTLKSYYQVLVDTFVGHWMPAYARKARKRLLTTPRFYFFDTGVRNAAAEVPAEGRILNAEGGRLLEHWTAQELLARAGYLGRGHRLSFWRTTYGVEVDFVWEAPREDVPIEVKWTTNPQPGDARHLERFLDEYPARAKRGIVVCRCQQSQQLTPRVRAIPWEIL